MKYNKLVRDKIPEILNARGIESITHIADEDEYALRLRAKLLEEVGEFLSSGDVEELADIHEVLTALAQSLGVGQTELEQIRENKAEAKGRFAERVVLEETKPSP